MPIPNMAQMPYMAQMPIPNNMPHIYMQPGHGILPFKNGRQIGIQNKKVEDDLTLI